MALPPNQLLALFNKVIKKIISLLEEVNVTEMNSLMFKSKEATAADTERINKMQPLAESLESELNEAAAVIRAKEMYQKKELLDVNFKQYEIKGTENEWTDALKLPASSSYVTVKR